MIYYGNAVELEYDLHVKPGADVRQIRLRLSGERARLDREGNLVAALMQKRPVAYQIGADGARVEVTSRYRKNRDGSYGFALGHYDPASELVIDPVVTLATYLSGPSFQDIAYAIGHDAAGFEYVAGITDSGDFPVTGDARQGTLNGINDLFVVKIDPHAPSGSEIVYATYLGGALNETFGGMAVSPRGDVYLTGTTVSTDFPTVNPYQGSLNTNATSNAADAFVVWIDSNLDLAYSTYLGGTKPDAGYAITFEGTAKLWVTGGTQSTDFPTLGGIQSASGGSQDIFVAGFDLSQAGTASLTYSTYLGGTWWETGRGIALAADGTLWIAAGTYSFDTPAVGSSYQRTFAGGGDAYVAHINPALGADGVLYSTFLGGTGLEEARSVVLDAAGHVIVSGYTTSTNFPVTTGALAAQVRRQHGRIRERARSRDATGRTVGLLHLLRRSECRRGFRFEGRRKRRSLPGWIHFVAGSALRHRCAASQLRRHHGRFRPEIQSRARRRCRSRLFFLSRERRTAGGVCRGFRCRRKYLYRRFHQRAYPRRGGRPWKTERPRQHRRLRSRIQRLHLGYHRFTASTSASKADRHRWISAHARPTAVGMCSATWTGSAFRPPSGSGNATVVVNVAPNDTGSPRQGSIRIAGVLFTIDQD